MRSNPNPVETYPDDIPLPPGDGRCMYRFPSGPRCRHAASQIHPYLCDAHLHHAAQLYADASNTPSPDALSAPQPEPSSPPYDPALVAEMAGIAGNFSSPEQVNGAMGKIFEALLHRRISAREAGTLCYIAQTILNGQRTVSYMEKNKPPRVRTFINDLPMAIRD